MRSTYGLIGHPLIHSFSQSYFRVKFKQEGIDADYLNFDVPLAVHFPRIVKENPTLRGMNVTIPFKQKIIPHLDGLDPDAKEIGAVNTIDFKDGKKIGYNTDYVGFVNSIKPLLLPEDTKALVLGTGGSSRAVVYGLQKLGIETTLVSRKPKDDILSYEALTEQVMHEHGVIINTTPVGMFPNINDAPPIPYEYITNGHLLFDLIYNPAETVFLEHGVAAGARTKNGFEMLQLQAEAAWEIWNRE